MPKKKKPEIGTRTPELQEILDYFEGIRENLFNDPKVSATKFNHYQSTIHCLKNVVRQLYGAKKKSDIAWIK